MINLDQEEAMPFDPRPTARDRANAYLALAPLFSGHTPASAADSPVNLAKELINQFLSPNATDSTYEDCIDRIADALTDLVDDDTLECADSDILFLNLAASIFSYIAGTHLHYF